MSALLSLESNLAFNESFDLIVGVSPFPNDRTADFLETAGIKVPFQICNNLIHNN